MIDYSGDSTTKVTAPAFERFARYRHEPADLSAHSSLLSGPVRMGGREVLRQIKCSRAVFSVRRCLTLKNKCRTFTRFGVGKGVPNRRDGGRHAEARY